MSNKRIRSVKFREISSDSFCFDFEKGEEQREIEGSDYTLNGFFDPFVFYFNCEIEVIYDSYGNGRFVVYS